MNPPVTRRCSKCRKKIGVSALEKPEKRYICPRCRGEPWYMTKDWLSWDVHKTKIAQQNWGKRREDWIEPNMDLRKTTGGAAGQRVPVPAAHPAEE